MPLKIAATATLLFSVSVALAQEDTTNVAGGNSGGGRPITLPTTVTDNAGSVWTIYANGMVQQQGGGIPIFGQLGQFTVNGNAANANRLNMPNGMIGNMPGGMAAAAGGGASARIDDRTGEVTLSNLTVGGFIVTRRILVEKETASLRFADTFRNLTNAEKAAVINYSGSFNFGIQSSRLITPPDLKKSNQPLGWIGMTGNNRAIFSAWGLTGGKVIPRVNYPEGSNVLNVSINFQIPGNKDISVVHYHGSTDTLDKAAGEVSAARFSKLLPALPDAVRRSLVNLPARGANLPDDLEILRGEQTDVIETTTGDLLRGSFQDKTFPLTTFFGKAQLPAEKVLAIVTLGRQRPMHLLLTSEGELFGGTLDLPALTFQLASGQTIKLPITQFRRAGARMAPTPIAGADEPRMPRKPLLFLRNGQRLAIAAPTNAFDFASRYGPLSIPANKIVQLSLYSPTSPVHQVTLTDGSKFSAILTVPKFDLTLDGAVGSQSVSVPTPLIAALQPTAPGDDDASPTNTPQLRTLGEDLFVGSLTGTLQLDTAFETIDIPADGIRSIRRANENPETSTTFSELRITQWDGTVLTGTPKSLTLPVNLASGLSIAIPVDLIAAFDNPKPRPSAAMAETIKVLIAKLNDDDFKTREQAQAQLLANGSSILPLLKEARETQPPPAPEVQQRLDTLIGQLDK